MCAGVRRVMCAGVPPTLERERVRTRRESQRGKCRQHGVGHRVREKRSKWQAAEKAPDIGPPLL